jgi:hypothetical protein
MKFPVNQDLRVGSIIEHHGNEFTVIQLNVESVTNSKGYIIGDQHSEKYFRVELTKLGTNPRRGKNPDRIGDIHGFTHEMLFMGWAKIIE